MHHSMRFGALLCLGLGAACSEYEINGKEQPTEGADDTADPVVDPPEDTGESTIEEECNGVDDDGDGEVDEGFPDTDGDGIKDCLDEDCETESPGAVDAEQDEECLAPDIEVLDPWNVAIEWQYTVPSGTGVIVMPAVGNLNDDNGDGKIDEHDLPDIVFTTWGSNQLVALHGDGSGVLFSKSNFNGNAGVAIADVNSDGVPDVVAATTSNTIAAVTNTGSLIWQSQSFSWQYYPQPVVTDLEGDGDVEIVFDIAVVNGSDGSTVTTLSGLSSSWRAPVVADLDKDGTKEILLGEKCYSHTGAVEFEVSRVGDSTFAAVADVDGDGFGESFWVTGNKMHLRDHDGTHVRTVSLNASASRPGPPAVADFDGDGDVEIAVPASSYIEMFEANGTRLWAQSIQDSSGIAGCSGYDIDADGVYELLYADEVKLRIFDGATGTVRYENSSHSSGTLWEYPVVADVDADGSAEIVIASNGSTWKGVTVLGHAGDGWAPSGPTWAVHDFSVTNINPDGSVPSPVPDAWDVYNVFRARPTVDDAAVNLAVRVVDVCFAGCIDESAVSMAIQVDNRGGLDSAEDLLVALYALDGEVETPIDVLPVGAVVAPGRSSETITFDLTRGQIGEDGVLFRVDDDGTGEGIQSECDESDNTTIYADWPC